MYGSGHIRPAALLVVTAVLVAGCSTSPGNKAGGADDPVVVRMATTDSLPGIKPQVGYLVDRVEQLSAGNVRIDMVYGVGNHARNAERVLLGWVAGGTYDLGVVGTRVFDTLGVNSFRALTVPMLIDSYPLEQAVIDSDIPAQMLRSLDRFQISGLGVLADSLQNPAGFEEPLLSLEDWRGINVAVFDSEQQAAALRALGARPTGGSPDAGESSLFAYDLFDPYYLTANVNLWPQTLAIIGDPDRLTGLSSEQRGWLDQAVRDAAVHSTGLVEAGSDRLVDLCAAGARIALASDADVAALHEAFAPVIAEARQDPQTAAFIAEIELLKEQMPAGEALSVPDGCTGTTVDPSPDVPITATQETPLDGVWEVTYSRDELVAAHPDPSEVEPSNYGTFTLEFREGNFAFGQPKGGPLEWTLIGSYAVDGDEMVLYVAGNQEGKDYHGPEMWRYTWSVYRDSLTFEKVFGEAPDCSLAISLGRCEPTGIVVKPWRRVST